MATIKHHEDLEAWQLANELKLRVMAILKRPEVARHFKFCDQIDRSSRSGPANLAEAFWKYKPKEKAYFVRIALGSLGETQNHLRDGRDRDYYSETEFGEMWTLAKRAIGASIKWHTYLMSCPDQPPTKQERTKTDAAKTPQTLKPVNPKTRKPKT
jgi:four helix bundle protein